MTYEELPALEQPVVKVEFTRDEVDTLRLIFNHRVGDKVLFTCLTDFQRGLCSAMHEMANSI